MSTKLRDQTDNDHIVRRVNCEECSAFLIDWSGVAPVFLRDCPGCGADVLQQPEDPDIQSFADSYGRQA